MAASTLENKLSRYDELLLEYSPRPIHSQRQYRRVLGQIDGLMRKTRLSRAEDNLLEVLVAIVKQYEKTRHPAPDVPPGDVVAHLIEARGATKAEVARATAIPRQTITNIVNGTRGISKANRAKLAKYFGVSPELFFNGG